MTHVIIGNGPAGVVLAISIALVGRLADRYPTYVLVSIGLALLAASFGLMALVGLQTTLWVVVGFAIVGRVGLGFILPSLNLGSLQPLAPALMPSWKYDRTAPSSSRSNSRPNP